MRQMYRIRRVLRNGCIPIGIGGDHDVREIVGWEPIVNIAVAVRPAVGTARVVGGDDPRLQNIR